MPFGQTKNGLLSGRLACTSSKTEILNKVKNLDFNPEFSINSECFFTQIT